MAICSPDAATLTESWWDTCFDGIPVCWARARWAPFGKPRLPRQARCQVARPWAARTLARVSTDGHRSSRRPVEPRCWAPEDSAQHPLPPQTPCPPHAAGRALADRARTSRPAGPSFLLQASSHVHSSRFCGGSCTAGRQPMMGATSEAAQHSCRDSPGIGGSSESGAGREAPTVDGREVTVSECRGNDQGCG